jgi:modification methylase
LAETTLLADPELASVASKRSAPRVPFGTLVERGLINAGEVLFDQNRRWSARVRADGTLVSAESRGSIHQVAAQIQGAPSCNGWTFWCIERSGHPVPIDMLRQQIQAEFMV